jgi:endoglucanase
MSGVQNEPTQDAGGGLNLGYQDHNDWADYQVNMPSAGTYTVNFRIATMVAGARFQVKKSDGSVLATVNVPSTGAYQAWQTISTELFLESGAQTLRLHTIASPGGWNLNWFEFIPSGTSAARMAVSTEERNIPELNTASLSVYPNPVADRLMIQVNSEETGEMKVEFFNISGSVQKVARLPKAEKGTSQNYLSLGELPKGTYMVRVTIGKFTKTQKLIKL